MAAPQPQPSDGSGLQAPIGGDAPEFRYQMPVSLYSALDAGTPGATRIQTDFDATVALGAPVSWFIPAMVTGVPGLLIILLVGAHVLIGASWLPTVGRLLGAEPDLPDDDRHIWWAAGRPIS